MDPEQVARLLPRARRLMSVAGVVIALGGAAGFGTVRMLPGQAQPIPFSHRLHAGAKGINCLFCHSDVDRSAYPGLPPVAKCLLCHNVIVPEFRPVRPLHEAAAAGEGVPWNRVNVVPDFVYFNHQIHRARGFDCGTCHGNVREMDRVEPPAKFTMGYCVDCHKRHDASTDCYVCHR